MTDHEIGEERDATDPGAAERPHTQSPAIAFNAAINRRDLGSLEALMTEGHTFIDSEDNVLVGSEKVLKAWEGFFNAFPDYRNEWSRVIPTGGALTAVGRSVCSTEPALDGPALWTAKTTGDKVSEWRVFEDTPANRDRLGVAEERPREARPAALAAIARVASRDGERAQDAARGFLTRLRMARRNPSASG